MNIFRLDNDADIIGTSFHMVTVKVNPQNLIEILGKPQDCDEYKISGMWVFTNGDAVFTVYDWKATNLYDEIYPSSQEYWSKSMVELHIGHKREFKEQAMELAEYLERISK